MLAHLKISVFYEFSFRFGKKNRRPAADSILMPPTFPIARLNRYTPNFSGVTQKLTWCQQFGLQIFPKWGDADIFRLEMAVFRCFFGRNKFSRPNGRLSPVACHTYLENLCINGQFKQSGNHFSASYEASGFCWQIGLNILHRLRPCHMHSPLLCEQQFCILKSLDRVWHAKWIWWAKIHRFLVWCVS